MTTTHEYLLGHTDPELVRLAHQAKLIAPATKAILTLAGLTPGMRVLDLGTGIGDVALLAAELVGPTGSVVGIDREERAIATARRRTTTTSNVSFERGDILEWRDPSEQPFDAVVGRLVHMHHPDPAAVVRHQRQALREHGIYVAMDWDYLTTRADPASPLLQRTLAMMSGAARLGGVDAAFGARLDEVLAGGGLEDVQALGVRPFANVEDGARSVCDLAENFHPGAVRGGVVGPDDLGIDTLRQRMIAEIDAAQGTFVMPTLVGAWGRQP
ncbi:methyltransferase domain-containing protein [Tenggerimyces flavus]|uniref:Methyltransferase domain-containing protein n=1 Tax=Tenggerimyces flavus TaxID=1708749 RepID=A0ABV7YDI7_9ACTN|nr:methyltransferase domain-containing protein [Tenggerimyces flavus]MBM7783398.1 SAM-dependent methyltransferase [Tenggerimyces flavus]